jgi:hypothetical protein
MDDLNRLSYKVVKVYNQPNGWVEKEDIERVINLHVSEGYRLHTALYNNPSLLLMIFEKNPVPTWIIPRGEIL